VVCIATALLVSAEDLVARKYRNYVPRPAVSREPLNADFRNFRTWSKAAVQHVMDQRLLSEEPQTSSETIPARTSHIKTALVRVLQSFVAHLSEHSLKLINIRAIKLVVLREKKVSELASDLIVGELGDFAD
jgi:hypothetical protein